MRPVGRVTPCKSQVPAPAQNCWPSPTAAAREDPRPLLGSSRHQQRAPRRRRARLVGASSPRVIAGLWPLRGSFFHEGVGGRGRMQLPPYSVLRVCIPASSPLVKGKADVQVANPT